MFYVFITDSVDNKKLVVVSPMATTTLISGASEVCAGLPGFGPVQCESLVTAPDPVSAIAQMKALQDQLVREGNLSTTSTPARPRNPAHEARRQQYLSARQNSGRPNPNPNP